MKTQITVSLTSFMLAWACFAQEPAASLAPPAPVPAVTSTPALPPTPFASPVVSPTIAAGAAVSPAASPSATTEEDLERRIERKVKRGLHITVGDDEEKSDARRRDRDDLRGWDPSDEDTALMAIPIVAIIFTTLFGAPVMIVAVIMFFSYWKQRSLHRTVRMLVEKGQPIPEGLFVAPPASPAKQRSDMRRGIIWTMVGLGIMLFFAAVTEFEGGAWALGIIPFLIGCAFLLVWKLEGGRSLNGIKSGTDNPPPIS